MSNPLSHTHRGPATRCPNCGAELDASSGVTTADAPEPGDVTVCMYCGALLIYGDDLVQRLPNAAELAEVKANPEQWATVQRVRGAISLALGKRNAGNQ